MKSPAFAYLAVCLGIISVLFTGCPEDATAPPAGGGVVPITANLFPLVVGNKLTYTGYAKAPGTGATIPDPNGSYKSIWTIATNSFPTPLGGTATAIIDSTTIPFGSSTGTDTTVARFLLVQQDSSGDFLFLQTIGPFKRLFGIPVTTPVDTFIWVAVARPSQGVGSTGAVWTAYDASFTAADGITVVRLQIFGQIEAMETIQDSTGTDRETFRSRTWRRLTVGGSIIQDDATTSQLWLTADLGPVQINIEEDTENLGHFRVLSGINF